MSKISFTKYYKQMLCIPAAIIVIALVMSIFGMGMNFGIDFTGGAMLTYDMGGEYSVDSVYSVLDSVGITDRQVAQTGTDVKDQLQIRLHTEDAGEEKRDQLDQALTEQFPECAFVSAEYVGAVAGRDLIANAIYSVLIVSVCILIYIAIRFDLRSGVAAVFALLHDVFVMLCFMVLFRGMFQVNSSFIAAMLTIVGYSINNTIIIFDRIRENQKKGELRGKLKMDIVDISVHETFARTINTTVTTLITIVALYVLGGDSIREFAFPIIVGICAGVFSSVMLAGQTWATIMDNHWLERKPAAAKAKKA